MCFSVFEHVACLMDVPTKAPSCSKSSSVCRAYKMCGGNICDMYLSSSMCASLFGYLAINEYTQKEGAVTLPPSEQVIITNEKVATK